MKRFNNDDDFKGKLPGEQVTPLEERVLRMHLGVSMEPQKQLEDASGGQAALGHSLSGIEADVRKRAGSPHGGARDAGGPPSRPPASSPAKPRHLYLVVPKP